MSFWTLGHISNVTQGRWCTPPPSTAMTLTGLSTDTRTLTPGQVFLALAGDRYDGHDYLAPAIHAGATLLIIQREETWLAIRDELTHNPAIAHPVNVLLVEDTLEALTAMATDYRDVLGHAGVKIIAVGGSNGKTTTRHLIHSLLLSTLKGTQSPKSFNNHIGVPLTLLAASEADDFVVVEVGTNHPGEIDQLGSIVRPHVSVITSIGAEHLEYFKNLAGVAVEEASLLAHTQPEGLVLLPGEPSQRALLEPHVSQAPASTTVQWFGSQSVSGNNVRTAAFEQQGCAFTDATGLKLKLPLLGRHNLDNALAAVATARWLGVPDEAIAQSLGSARGVTMRMEVQTLPVQGGSITLINDAYNANPDSMRAALEVLATMTPGSPGSSGSSETGESTGAAGSPVRRVAILGDMLELGDQSPGRHRELGQFIAELDATTRKADGHAAVDLVVLIGKLAMFAGGELARVWPDSRFVVVPVWDDTTPGRVAKLVNPGDMVLLKASRGMALERLIPAIEQHTSPSEVKSE